MLLPEPGGSRRGVMVAFILSRSWFGVFADVFAKQKKNAHFTNPLLPTLAAALIGLLFLWAYSKHYARRNIKSSEKLKRMKNADRVLVQILKNFSVGSVQDFYFRGIKQKVCRVSVQFKDITTTIKGYPDPCNRCKPGASKTLLAGVSGQFHAGRMSAIMGPSGAGKTTFLNALCGKLRTHSNWEVSGEVLVNGERMDIHDLKPVTGFVPQDDVVHESMTVRENIRFSAELRNAARTKKKRLNTITDDVLQVLQLEAQQHVLVGNRILGTSGLSGGQRKRVNIGLELAACPTLLFLDEPTSGLDATSSLLLCEMLKKMTHLGMTIVLVIHQPRYSLFTLIDDVLLLGKGGRTAYVGPTSMAKDYFERLGFGMAPNENPADWMMDILSGHVCIENPRMPTDSLPEALFHEWEQGTSQIVQQVRRQPSQRGRDLDDLDEREVLKRHIKDEWEKIGPEAGPLDQKGFAAFLASCLGFELQDMAIVEDIMQRAGGVQDATGSAFPRMVGARVAATVAARSAIMQRNTQEKVEALTQHQFARYLIRFRDVNRRGAVNDDISDMESGSSAGEDTDESDSDVSVSDCEAYNDLDRTLPGCWVHFRVELQRSLLTSWRQMTIRICFLIVIEFAAGFLGFFDAVIFKSQPWMPTVLLNLHISIALLISVFCLTLFSLDQPIYWREASHGLNRFAFMHARMLVGTIDWLALCFFFTATYYCIVLPRLSFQIYIVPFVLVSFVASGWGYLISCVLPPVLAPFCAAVLSFMLGGILGLPDKMSMFLDGGILEVIVNVVCFTRWSVPMDFFASIYRQPLNTTAMDFKVKWQYDAFREGYSQGWLLPMQDSKWWTGCIVLMVMGCVLRTACYPALRLMNRSKQV